VIRAEEQRAQQTLACPACGDALKTDAASVECRRCAKVWPIVDRVPYFVEEFPYWGEVPLAQMRDINRRVQTNNWREVLKQSDDPAVQQAATMVLNLDRANWHWLSNTPADARVLDIGAGMGTNSHALSTYYREVVAVEPVEERIRFMRQRFQQENLSNVSIIRGSVWTLPFQEESFDLAALNGVLEWVPGGREDDPEACQEAALRRLHTLLRPGGSLYVGIENRYCLGYFFGHPDPHCGLPFVTVLPRRLAHWYARRKGQNGYRNYLYSAAGYRKLLQKAGFTKVEIYVALPSYNHPHFFIPLGAGLFSYYARTFTSAPAHFLKRGLQTVLSKLGLLEHCGYSFAIIAKK